MRFPDRGLYCITDPALARGRSHIEQARLCLEGGARVIQMRDKSSPREVLLPVARRIAALCRERDVPFVVNDDPTLAVEAGADGVHVGQDDMPPAEARRIVGPGRLIGLSTHTRAQLLAAQRLPVDYVGFGPIFATHSKDSPYAPLGPSELAWALKTATLPVVPIGGIGPDTLASLAAVGATRAAVISAAVGADDIAAAVRALSCLL
jgi:thiamine-phosphate pyrophosphorylase